jgi:hypothetical protein
MEAEILHKRLAAAFQPPIASTAAKVSPVLSPEDAQRRKTPGIAQSAESGEVTIEIAPADFIGVRTRTLASAHRKPRHIKTRIRYLSQLKMNGFIEDLLSRALLFAIFFELQTAGAKILIYQCMWNNRPKLSVAAANYVQPRALAEADAVVFHVPKV